MSPDCKQLLICTNSCRISKKALSKISSPSGRQLVNNANVVQLVERLVANEKVAGSSPVVRSIVIESKQSAARNLQ